MNKERMVWYIAKTYINCYGEADVSVRCIAGNGWESYWSSNLLDERIQYFDTQEEAKGCAYMWANTDMTVHGRWIKE